LAFICTELESLTIVYDKGNHSKKNQASVDGQFYHYIASLTPGLAQLAAGVPSGF